PEKPGRERRGCAKEVQRPRPSDRAKGKLETARPVHATLRRIGLDPFLDLSRERGCVTLVAGEPVRLSKAHEVLMPVQLPDDLVIADERLGKERDPTPVLVRCPNAAEWIDRPVDRTPEVEPRAAEEIEPSLHRALGVGDDAH